MSSATSKSTQCEGAVSISGKGQLEGWPTALLNTCLGPAQRLLRGNARITRRNHSQCTTTISVVQSTVTLVGTNLKRRRQDPLPRGRQYMYT
jgi:hypothetical protein